MGLIEIDATHKATIISLAQYIVSRTGIYAEIIRKHYSSNSEKSLIKLAEMFLHPQKLEGQQEEPTKKARRARRKFVQQRQEVNMEEEQESWAVCQQDGRARSRQEQIL